MIDRGVTEDRFEIRHAFKGASYLETYDEIDIGIYSDLDPYTLDDLCLKPQGSGATWEISSLPSEIKCQHKNKVKAVNCQMLQDLVKFSKILDEMN